MSVETFSPLVATPPTAEARPGATGAHGHDDVAEHGAAEQGHGPASEHTHSAGHHRSQLHGHATHAARVGPSMLRLSLPARLAVAALLLLPLWVAVMLVTE